MNICTVDLKKGMIGMKLDKELKKLIDEIKQLEPYDASDEEILKYALDLYWYHNRFKCNLVIDYEAARQYYEGDTDV